MIFKLNASDALALFNRTSVIQHTIILQTLCLKSSNGSLAKHLYAVILRVNLLYPRGMDIRIA